MDKVFTACNISEWFTSEATFANIKLKEEAEEPQVDEAESPVPSELEASVPSSPTTVKSDGDQSSRAQAACGSSPPPPLEKYKYPALPITKNREKLVSLIESNSVVIIRGATGSGKTTLLPQFILDHYMQRDKFCNIVVTQPRKIGASSIARWVATQRRCTLGSMVGYQVGLEKTATEQTRLIYMTTGVLLQKLVQIKSLTQYTHIFVDEIHERTEELDFLLLIVRKLLHLNSPYVKIILMSATINCQEFAEYFSTLVQQKMIPACVFEVEGEPYAIEEFYLDDLEKLFPVGVVYPHPADPSIPVAMYNLAISLIQSFDEMEGAKSSEGDAASSERGSVLVFLPGLREIHYMQEALANLVHKRLQVYPLHSTVTLEEQNGVFLLPVPGYRKVILSTNIAESSVTVPDVKYVIDFCLVRHLICDQDTNYHCLQPAWASKTNCNQRRGRAGRTSKGYCYRLVNRQFWDQEMPEFMIPEMLLAPLATVMLKVKLLNMGDPRSVLSTALSPPNLNDIVRTVLLLKQLGAFSSKNDGNNQYEDGTLTFLGRVLAQLPVDPRLGKMVVLGHVFGCLDECLIMAAAHSLRSFFAAPSMQRIAGYRSKLTFAQGTPSDPIAFVNAFKAWYSAKKKGQLRHPKDELRWGKENFIQIKVIREVAELYEDLKSRVDKFKMHLPVSAEAVDFTSLHRRKFILQVVIAGAYYPNYFVQGNMDDEQAFREIGGNDPRTTVIVRNLPPYSFLYYKQLQSLFRLCGQVKTISIDSSRAYVEFQRSAHDTGVLTEVSLALLLKVDSPMMELSTYPAEQIEFSAGSSNIFHLKYGRVNVDIQSQTVSPLGVLSSLTDPDDLPPNRSFLVSVTEVVDVGNFWGFQADEASLERQRQLTGQINSRQLEPVSVTLYPNLLCLAPYSEAGHTVSYYRARILHIRSETVEVFFVDFGNTEVVTSCSLRKLPPDLLVHPFQAQEFQVIEMCPSAGSVIHGRRWSGRARDRFVSLVKGHSLLVVLYSVLHSVLRVQLFISTEMNTSSVLDILVEEGHALKVEESYKSKENHATLMSLYRDIEAGTYVPSYATGRWKQREAEDKQLIDNLLSHFSGSRQSYSKTKARLTGPDSPNKISFHSMSHKLHHKIVSVDKLSINSVAVNENLHHRHQRMLVSGYVSVSSSGTHILLRDTSIMPDIPGLPALVTMLFAPVMELRTNEEGTCYTGALCGLGCNRQTQEPLLPEHDIELPFDVKFDVEDITEINALRAAMNELTSDTRHMTFEKISRLQKDCQGRLIRLFTKSPQREAVAPVEYRQCGQWNQVDPALKINFEEPKGPNSTGFLFGLHPIVLLNS